METHRVVHDFGELRYEDIEPAESFHGEQTRSKMPLLAIALSFGVVVGFLLWRR